MPLDWQTEIENGIYTFINQPNKNLGTIFLAQSSQTSQLIDVSTYDNNWKL